MLKSSPSTLKEALAHSHTFSSRENFQGGATKPRPPPQREDKATGTTSSSRLRRDLQKFAPALLVKSGSPSPSRRTLESEKVSARPPLCRTPAHVRHNLKHMRIFDLLSVGALCFPGVRMFSEPMHTPTHTHTCTRSAPPVAPINNETHPFPHLLSAPSENTRANLQ